MDDEYSRKSNSSNSYFNENAPHFIWGNQCDGWWLKNTGKFTVISESMPSGTAKSIHNLTEQFFYCLSGELSIQVGTQEYTLREHEGLEIAATQNHKVQNKSNKIVQFLIISSPNSHEDRVDLE